MLINASAPDAFFVVDINTRRLVTKERLPSSIYGSNYELGHDTNLAEHYIHNDLQLAHLNSGFPLPNGDIVYTTLIQGHLGCLTKKNEWRVLLEGYIGCHGARCTEDGEEIYFVHSPFGDLIFTDKNGKIKRKFHTESIWLHDVQQIPSTNCFLLSDSENNKLLCL